MSELLAVLPDDIEQAARALLDLACGGEPVRREEHFGDIDRGPVRLAALRVALDLLTDTARAHSSI